LAFDGQVFKLKVMCRRRALGETRRLVLRRWPPSLDRFGSRGRAGWLFALNYTIFAAALAQIES